MTNLEKQISINVVQLFGYYKGFAGNNSKAEFQASGAYIFRPNGSSPETQDSQRAKLTKKTYFVRVSVVLVVSYHVLWNLPWMTSLTIDCLSAQVSVALVLSFFCCNIVEPAISDFSKRATFCTGKCGFSPVFLQLQILWSLPWRDISVQVNVALVVFFFCCDTVEPAMNNLPTERATFCTGKFAF